MSETDYLKLELEEIGNPGQWTTASGGNSVLGGISDALATAMPQDFPYPDKVAGQRTAKLMWLGDVVSRKLTSSKQLYPVEAIRILHWLEGRNLVTGEDEPEQEALIVGRLSEVELWINQQWETIKSIVTNVDIFI